MTSTAPQASIDAFFESFCAAFATFDGAAVARLYHEPHIALRGDASVQLLERRDTVSRFFQGALDAYHAAGCRSCRYRDLNVVALGGMSVVATVTWELVGAAGDIRRQWSQSYNLLRDPSGDGWLVLTSTEHVDAPA